MEFSLLIVSCFFYYAAVSSSHDSYAAFRSGSYWRYAVAHCIDILGMQMAFTAVGWEIYERTHSALALGLVGLMKFLPTLIFSIPAGHLIEVGHRRLILWTAQLPVIAGALGLTLVSVAHAPVPSLYFSLFLIGIGMAVSLPARSALFPQIIPPGSLQNAVTWNHVARQTGTIAGPLLGGLSIAATGSAVAAYVTCAALGVIFIALIAAVPYRRTDTTTEPASLSSMLAGARFLKNTPILLSSIIVDTFAVLFGGATALLPMFAKDILHVGPFALGCLRLAPAVGALGMSAALTRAKPVRNGGRALLFTVALFGVSMILFGISTNVYLSFFLLTVSGATDALSVVIRHTLLQSRTPSSLIGRVYAVMNIFGMSSNELGEVESGLIAMMAGPVFSVVSGGVGSIVVVLCAATLWPELRKLRSLHTEKEAAMALTGGSRQTGTP